MKRFSPKLFVLGLVLGALAAVFVAGAYGRAASPNRRGALVALRKTNLGTVLVDARGRTLYLFEKDRKGMSACGGSCAKFWPPLVSRGTPRAGKGVHRSMLGLTKRTDGRRQVTYAGHPLYAFIGDKAAGQTTGEGLSNFGAKWYALAASGRAVKSSGSSSGGSGYGSGGGW
jgi:predicted lipoprotein with Yx(FWY)xxD motif